MLTSSCSNARLRGTSSKQSSAKSNASSVSEDGRLNSPSSLSHRSKSSSNLSARTTPVPSSPASPAPAQTISSTATGDDILNSYRLPTPFPMWLNPAYAKHIVKGNFMTLSSRPKTVEQGEWMAHQGTPSVYLIFSPSSTSDISRQWLSIIATCGTLSTLYLPRSPTERTSATPPPAPACPLGRKSPPAFLCKASRDADNPLPTETTRTHG